jgi:hypothetical protein
MGMGLLGGGPADAMEEVDPWTPRQQSSNGLSWPINSGQCRQPPALTISRLVSIARALMAETLGSPARSGTFSVMEQVCSH